MFHFATCLCRVTFYGRNSMGFSGVVSLISLSGRWTLTLSSVFVGCLIILGFLLFGGSFLGGFSTPAGILIFVAPTYSCMCSVSSGMQNGLRQQESTLCDLKYQQVEKR